MNKIEIGQAPDNGFSIGDFILIDETLHIISDDCDAVDLETGHATQSRTTPNSLIAYLREEGHDVVRIDRPFTITPASGERR